MLFDQTQDGLGFKCVNCLHEQYKLYNYVTWKFIYILKIYDFVILLSNESIFSLEKSVK